jgi:hypothetical protein
MWRLVSLQLSVIVDTLCVHDRATRCFLTLSWQQVCIFVYMCPRAGKYVWYDALVHTCRAICMYITTQCNCGNVRRRVARESSRANQRDMLIKLLQGACRTQHGHETPLFVQCHNTWTIITASNI